MPRVSRKQLEGICELVNGMLERRGSVARVTVSQRYDYHALDLTTALDLERKTGHYHKPLALGRTGDIERYLRGMSEALFLLEEPWTTDNGGRQR